MPDILVQVGARRNEENEAIREACLEFLKWRTWVESHIKREAIGRGTFAPEAALGRINSLKANVCEALGVEDMEEYT